MIACRPVRYSKKGMIAATVFILLSPVCMYLSQLDFIAYGVILQLLGLSSISIGIYSAIRYSILEFQYMIYDRDGKSDLAIVRIMNDRSSEIFRLSLDCYLEIEEKTKGSIKRIKGKYGKISRKMNYRVNLDPKKAYIAVFKLNEEICTVEFEPDFVFIREMELRKKTEKDDIQ